MSTLRKLRDGRVSWDDALAGLDGSGRGARELATELARRANDEQARRLLVAAGRHDEAGPGRFLFVIAAEALIASGTCEPVLALSWPIRRLVGFAVTATEQLDSDRRSAVLSSVARQLHRVADGDEQADALTITTTKYFIHHLAPDLGRALVAWLEPRVAAEDAAGDYQELDYAYGQVDPIVELALCCARTGQPDAACRHLQARETRSAQMMHLTELLDLAAISDALPATARATWWPKLRSWAAATDASGFGAEGESLETAWLLRATAPVGVDVARPLTALIEAAELPQRLHDVLLMATVPAVRQLARRRLIEMTSALVSDLTGGDGETARQIRALRSASVTLESCFDELEPTDRRDVAEAVRRWAAWLAGHDTGDWLEHYVTAIAFAKGWRDELEPAAARLRAEAASGNSALPRREGWERLF